MIKCEKDYKLYINFVNSSSLFNEPEYTFILFYVATFMLTMIAFCKVYDFILYS